MALATHSNFPQHSTIGVAPQRCNRNSAGQNYWEAGRNRGQTHSIGDPAGRVQPAWRIPGSAPDHHAHARMRRCAAVVARRVSSRVFRFRSEGAVSVSFRSAGGAGHSGRHRGLDHDGGLDRFRDPADDADAGLHAVFSAHHRQLFQGSRDAMDAGDFSRHIFLLHGGASRGALCPAPVRAGRHGAGSNAAGAGLRRLAAVLHPSHFARDQRQPYRGPDRVGNRGDYRRDDAVAAPARAVRKPTIRGADTPGKRRSPARSPGTSASSTHGAWWRSPSRTT